VNNETPYTEAVHLHYGGMGLHGKTLLLLLTLMQWIHFSFIYQGTKRAVL